MDTNKHDAKTSKVEATETETAKERKPIVDQMTDLAAQAAGALAETAVQSSSEAREKSCSETGARPREESSSQDREINS
jgi:hypothetical protein